LSVVCAAPLFVAGPLTAALPKNGGKTKSKKKGRKEQKKKRQKNGSEKKAKTRDDLEASGKTTGFDREGWMSRMQGKER